MDRRKAQMGPGKCVCIPSSCLCPGLAVPIASGWLCLHQVKGLIKSLPPVSVAIRARKGRLPLLTDEHLLQKALHLYVPIRYTRILGKTV